MNLVVIYDICHPRRLQRVAKIMEDYGKRTQKSVFEVEVGQRSQAEMRRRIELEINEEEDGVKYFPLCGQCMKLLWVFGKGAPPEDTQSVLVL